MRRGSDGSHEDTADITIRLRGNQEVGYNVTLYGVSIAVDSLYAEMEFFLGDVNA